MAGELGRITGQMILDVDQAIKSYTSVRQEHLSTISALGAGAGALTSVGAAFLGVGAAMTGGLVTAALAAGEFERKLDYFVAVGGPSAVDQYEAVRQKALELGNDTIYSADQIADSFIELAKSGVGVEDLLAGIGEAVSSLGAAADMPLEDAAKGLTTVLNTFGLAAEDAVSVVDKLAGAANSSSIDVNDLILTLTYAGASAKVAGIEFEDVNAAIALLGERGIRGSKAGTGLRQMFDKLLAPTNKGSKALKELGIVTEDGTNALIDMDGGLKPIPQLLNILNDSLSGLTTSEKMDILGDIFPITSLPTILNLLDGGADGIARLNEEIGKTTALDIAMARLDNFSGDLEILSGNLETLMINIGSVQQGFMRWVTQGLVAVTQWLNELDPAILNVIVAIVAISAAISAFIGIAGLFAGAILNIIGLIIALKDAIPAVMAVLGKFGAFFTKLKGLMVLPAGIIGVIIAIITALVLFFTKTEEGQAVWGRFVQQFQETLAGLQPFFEALGTAFDGLMSNLIPILVQVVTLIVGGLTAALVALAPLIEGVGNVLITVFGWALGFIVIALTFIVDILNGPFGAALLIAVGVVLAVVAAIKIWTAVQTILNIALSANPIGIIIMAIAALVAAIIWVATETTFFQDAWAAISAFLIATWTAISDFFITVWTNVSNFFIEVWNNIVAFLTPILNFIAGIIRFYVEMWVNIFLVMAAVFVTIWNWISTIFTTVWNAILAFITPIITFIVDLIVGYITNVLTFWIGVWTAISDFFTGIWNALIAFLTPIIAAVLSVISGTIQTVQGIWNGVWNAIFSFFQAIWNNIVSGVKGPVNDVISTVTSIKDKIFSFFSGVGNWLLGMGKDLIGGLINGITSMFDGVIEAIGNVVNGAVDWAKGVLGIKSPSRVFMGIGVNTIQGMINGMDNMKGRLRNQMSMVADSLDTFYDQVYAAREFDVMMNLQSQMTVGTSLDSRFADLSEQLAEIADKDTFVVEKLEVKKEEGEELDESLPKAIRKTTFVLG